jgi:hypothetical protein
LGADPRGGVDIDVSFPGTSLTLYEFVSLLCLTPNLRRT